MRQLIVEVEASIDGAMGGERGDFWQQVFTLHSPDVQNYLNELMFMPDALVMGKRTYEAFAQIWPNRHGKEADRINAMPKYVASRSLKAPLRWNSTLLNGDAVDGIRTLKQQPGGSLLQYGVGELTRALLKAGLVDELRVLVFPFAFGDGPRIFDQMGVNRLKLLKSKTFSSGVVALHYQPQ
jgi:dihydrofolate reductase